MKNSRRWRIGILASAIALLGSLASLEAHAMALGRITVQSALGEPLRAEIDIPEINAEEAASLKAGVAPAETFKAAGFDYNSVVADLEVILQRRADGRAYLRLTSRRPVTEPFVDLIVQANWSSGRITRDYTMLFDPPIQRSGIAVAPTAPLLTRPQATQDAAPPARAIARTPDAAPSRPAARPAPVARTPAAQAGSAGKEPVGDRQVTVKAGDTAGKIAAQNKPASVSLDQMLVALLASNPDAFVGGNVNLLKAGAVLDIPGEQTASAIPRGEATQTLIAQSADFNAFRRKLAEGAPATKVATAERQAGGKVQAKVEDRAPATAAPDKLTLSKGAVQGKPASAVESKVAQDRQAKDASARVAELSKNISDLNKLEATPSVAPTAGASAARAPTVTVPVPAAAPVLSPPAPAGAASSADTPAAAAAPVSADLAAAPPPVTASRPASVPSAAVAPAAVAVAPKKPVVSAPPPPPEPSLIDTLLENPLVLPLGGVLLALLAGFGFYRYRQGSKAAQVDSSFLESRLQPDSFFGASGGQSIDTNDGNVTGSSLVYSPSQLDAAGDVDPVAEADVYLAYGRDLQAEEILKEALHTNPSRVAIHAKLMEIYAKRSDKKAFETVAIAAMNLTHGNGPEWAYITEMGRELDPDNPMYQPGAQQDEQPVGADAGAPNPPDTVAEDAQAAWPAPAPVPVVDVDLDLDFPLSDAPDMATTPGTITAQLPGAPARSPDSPMAMDWAASPGELEMDIDTATAALPTLSSPASGAKPIETSARAVTLPSDGLTFTPEPFTAAPKPELTPQKTAASVVAPADNGMLEFDLGSLSLDLSGPTTESPTHALTGMSDDPLETRFLLAEEFRAVGDTDGARSLAEEVLAKSSGPLKVKAQAFLSALS